MRKLNKNTRIILALAAFVCVMIGAAYASVPLYTLFCKATGLGGTTQRAGDSAHANQRPLCDREFR